MIYIHGMLFMASDKEENEELERGKDEDKEKGKKAESTQVLGRHHCDELWNGSRFQYT